MKMNTRKKRKQQKAWRKSAVDWIFNKERKCPWQVWYSAFNKQGR